MNKTDFEAFKTKASKVDLLYIANHKSGPTPSIMIERQTVFGAIMSICILVLCASVCAFVVLNWYYSPTLSSSLIPFGLVGEPDPVAQLRIQLDLWGWSGPCTLPLSSACALSFTVSGIGQTNGSQFLVSCTNRTYSCSIDISSSSAVISSFGSIQMTSPQGGNAMGVTYRASLTPSLNNSAPDTSETIFAGSSDVFGGSNPVLISLSTKWTLLRDETQGTARDGWIVGSAGVSPGSTLNNVTFLDPALDKQFRLSIALARGTELLIITLSYKSSIVILIGVIGGYMTTVLTIGRIFLRIVEAVRHTRYDTPTVVKECLAGVSTGPSSGGNKAGSLAASGTLGQYDEGLIELDPAPQITEGSNFHNK